MKQPIRPRQVIQAQALFDQAALFTSALCNVCNANTETML